VKRVSAPERTRERLRALIDGRLGTAPDRSNLVLLAAQLILEEALEGEVRDGIGRDRYERAGGDASGYRNGYRTGRMKTAEGMVEYAAPQVRETAEPFVSSIRQNLAGRTGALEDLAVELYARGLSTRDIEDAFTDEAGRRLLSRAAVSEITERLWAEYEAFTTRDLCEHRVVYLFVDGIAERLRAGQPREPVLAAWGIGEDGRKVLLHLMAGSKEDTETVRAFFQDMRGRGLGDPLLVVSDGAPGIIRAVEECFPRSARQRCLAHRMRNLAVKVPTDLWPEFKARASACYQAPSRAIARDLAVGLRADYGTVLPSALACFEDDFEACIAHLRLPVTHRRSIRTTDALDKVFSARDSFLRESMVRGRPPRYSSRARATTWPRAGKRMQSPPRCLHSRSSFVASAHPGRFGAVRFAFGRSLQAPTKRAYAASAWATKARSASRHALML
jgi:putative transposase